METQSSSSGESILGLAPKSLVRKLSEVMGEVERVPKNGRNEFHKYDYATETDITSAVRKGMAARHLVWVPEVQKTDWLAVETSGGKKERLCTMTVIFRVLDGDSGEALVIGPILGQGQDSGDKASYKAMTGATKYALLKTFLIPTGDDPEHEATKPEPARGVTGLKQTLAKSSPPRAPAPSGPPEPPPHTDADSQGEPDAEPSTRVRNHDGSMSFRFGKDKGTPLADLSENSLRFYRGAFQRDLADAEKSRFWPQTTLQLAAVEAELSFRGLALN